MAVDSNKAVARRFIDAVWNSGDLAVADELLDPALVNHDPDGQTTDKAGFLHFIRVTRDALPTIHFDIDDIIAESDKVVTRVTIRATEAVGAAGSSAQAEAWSGIGIIRIADGRIVEQWANTDSIGTALGTLQPQLG